MAWSTLWHLIRLEAVHAVLMESEHRHDGPALRRLLAGPTEYRADAAYRLLLNRQAALVAEAFRRTSS